MMRPPFVGHRRYSITHRAVQRLRELVPGRDEEDDESLRDRLDAALGAAEDSGKTIRTLDAMLGEPQTLIPVDAFGGVLYAIIKEDTVVTVLPQGHGEEILQRGRAMEQRVASGQAKVRQPERETQRWSDTPRRRWKESPQPVVIERIVRGTGNGNGNGNGVSGGNGAGAAEHREEPAAPSAPTAPVTTDASGLVVRLPDRPAAPDPSDPVANALREALEDGRRQAAVLALQEALTTEDGASPLLPLWNALAQEGVVQSLTVGDLVKAVVGAGDK